MDECTLSDGAVVAYQRRGAGEPLLQIHGSAFGHRNFERLSPHLARNFEVIDFDLPGFGQSRGGRPITGFADLAAQVAELIEALGYDRVHVHGTSFGAMIGFTLAAEHPQLIDRLVLSCFLARYDQAARVMRATWKRVAADSGMEAVADLTAVAGFARSYFDRDEAEGQLASMREAFSHTAPEAFVASTETIERTDLSGLADLVVAPTLLIAGAEDNMTPYEPSGSGVGMAQLAGSLKDAKSVVIPECGHYLVIEVPAEVAEMITPFLAG
jgi:pimeloyl-ACP methyl ester carboxylesterase